MPSSLEVRLLGAFHIKSGKKIISLASRPAQSLFAFLILNAGTAYRREKLAGLLWPESTEESARDYLRHALWRIRKALQEASAASYLKADDLVISFDAAMDYWLDVRALRDASESGPAEALIDALSAYRGELLPGFYDEWVVPERDHLHGVLERKVASLLELLQQAERWPEMLEWGEKWIAFGQKPEAAFRYLMSAYAGQGDRSKVALTYDRCVKSLAEFGFEPSEQTRSLYEALKAGEQHSNGVVVRRQAEPPAQASPTMSRIPIPLTSFIGRKKELKEIADLLSSTRLLTLTGTGGVGKTRLAIQAARTASLEFRDGVFWVELVGLAEGDLIPHAIALALDIQEMPRELVMVTLQRALRAKSPLLILDNCEHLIDASAECVEQLLAACPQLKILATSRERLGLFHETVWHVPSLSDQTSVALFTERARAARPDFAINDSNQPVVEQICQRLDRIPLAIELAAARMGSMSAVEIAEHLDDRFELLTSGHRTALSRQQTLRGVIDWSHDLLTAPERVLFRRLAVFAGGFSLKAAEAICCDGMLERGAIVDLLARLVDKSLVNAESLAQADRTRYRMLETIREYALGKFRETDDASKFRDGHLTWFTEFAEEAEQNLDGPEQAAWIGRVETEADNFRAGIAWSLSQEGSSDAEVGARRLEIGMRLTGALAQFWDRNHHAEGLARLNRMLAESAEPTPGHAKVLMALGFLYWSSPDQAAARPYLEQAEQIARTLGNPLFTAKVLGYLGAVLVALGEYEPARRCLAESLAIGRQGNAGGKNVVSRALCFLADIPYAEGDHQAARRLYEEAAAVAREAGDINSLTYTSRHIGYLALARNDFNAAADGFAESLHWNQLNNHFVGICRCIAAFACLRGSQGRWDQATQLAAASRSLLATKSAPLFHWDESALADTLVKLRTAMPDDAFEAAWDRGARMTLEEAVDLALNGG